MNDDLFKGSDGMIINYDPFKGGYRIVGTWTDDGDYILVGLPDFLPGTNDEKN